MLRSRWMSAANDRTLLPFREHSRLGREGLVLLAALGAIVASAPSLRAQSETAPGSDSPAATQPQICDGLKESGNPSLSLTLPKANPTEDGQEAATQPSPGQASEESPNRRLTIPGVNSSTAVPPVEGLLCRKKPKESEPARDLAPSSGSSQPVDEEPGTPPPTVSYTNGELTIHANNQRLGDVIEAIRTSVGLSVVLPAEPLDNRVFDRVGPAPLRDALTQFLYGSGLNYVIQTSSGDPQKVTRLILSSQTQLASAGPPQNGSHPAVNPVEGPALYGGAGFASETPGEPVDPVPVPAQPSVAATNVPGVPAGFNLQQAATASGKTTGQILDELQKAQLQTLDAQAPQQ